jgi:hypothetical protein
MASPPFHSINDTVKVLTTSIASVSSTCSAPKLVLYFTGNV